MGLRETGYEVRLAMHEPFRHFIESHGLDLAIIDGDPISWSAREELKSLVEAGRDFSSWMRRLKNLAKPLLISIFNSCWDACRGADALIYSPIAWAGYSIAEKLKIPSFPASVQPFIRLAPFRASGRRRVFIWGLPTTGLRMYL